MLVVEAIPFKSFKERLRLVSNYIGKAKVIIIYDTYIYVEKLESVSY